ncbi:MAG TPA: glycosyltransferase family 4 protein [Verrucomicrobiae bacterium]|nr:glycosyltransferase family 4 protein [Verrucomicrobiae bacterium]
MEYPVAQTGGVEVLVTELLRGLPSEFDVVLVSDDDDESLAASGLAPLIGAHFPWRFGCGTAASANALARDLKQAGVALAHFHFGGTYAWGSRRAHFCPIPKAARLGIPVLITNHWVSSPLEGYCGPSRPLLLKLGFFPVVWCNRLRVLGNTRFEIAVSAENRDLLRRILWPLRNRIGYIYHSTLDEAEPEPAVTADRRPPTILMVATIAPRKNQKTMITALDQIAADYPDWRLRLVGYVGDRQYYDELRSMSAAGRLGGRLEFAGPMTRTRVAEAMHEAAIFVLPSQGEGLGLSLQEAMFRGCACVATPVGGVTELVEDRRTGLLVPPDDVSALAEVLRKLIAQPELRRQLGENGRASILAKGMTRQWMIRRHVELYRRLLT